MKNKIPPLPNRYLIDFDGTICHTTYREGVWEMGRVIAGVKRKVNKLALTNEIIIFSARPKKEYPLMRRYLIKHKIAYDKIIKKPSAKLYVDDRSMRPDEFIAIWGDK